MKTPLRHSLSALLVVCLLIANPASAQRGAIKQLGMVKEKPDEALQQQLDTLVQAFRGEVGIYVRHLKTGRMAAIQADSLFPTASMIKIPISIGLFDKNIMSRIFYHHKFMIAEQVEILSSVTGAINASDHEIAFLCGSRSGGVVAGIGDAGKRPTARGNP